MSLKIISFFALWTTDCCKFTKFFKRFTFSEISTCIFMVFVNLMIPPIALVFSLYISLPVKLIISSSDLICSLNDAIISFRVNCRSLLSFILYSSHLISSCDFL